MKVYDVLFIQAERSTEIAKNQVVRIILGKIKIRRLSSEEIKICM